jgi:prophage regulatory protein
MYQPASPQILCDFDNLPDGALLRLKQLLGSKIIPFSASTLWRKVGCGQFPRPVKVSNSITAWRLKDIRTWLDDPSGFGTARSNTSSRQSRIAKKGAK